MKEFATIVLTLLLGIAMFSIFSSRNALADYGSGAGSSANPNNSPAAVDSVPLTPRFLECFGSSIVTVDLTQMTTKSINCQPAYSSESQAADQMFVPTGDPTIVQLDSLFEWPGNSSVLCPAGSVQVGESFTFSVCSQCGSCNDTCWDGGCCGANDSVTYSCFINCAPVTVVAPQHPNCQWTSVF